MLKKLPPGIVFLETGTVVTNNFQESLNKAIALFSNAPSFFQIVSLKPIVSLDQAVHAAEQTIYFHKHGQSISPKLHLEFLCRLTAQRQVSDALQAVEVSSSGTLPVLIAVYARNKKIISQARSFVKKEFQFKPNSKLLSVHVNKNFSFLQKFYNIADIELQTINPNNKISALQSLVLERMALLEINK